MVSHELRTPLNGIIGTEEAYQAAYCMDLLTKLVLAHHVKWTACPTDHLLRMVKGGCLAASS